MISKIIRRLGGVFLLGFSLKMSGEINFFTFPLQGYAEGDLHKQASLAPFPCIFHYNTGGDSSSCPMFRIINLLSREEVPEVVDRFLMGQGIAQDQIQYFEAFCIPTESTMNYFTHPWAMDRMVENREVLVSSGMFSAENLKPVEGEVGLGTVVAQKMSFHDGNCLSGNCARFQMQKFDQSAKAWFISIYDPNSNSGKNAPCNQFKRAIVVFWHFLPQGEGDRTCTSMSTSGDFLFPQIIDWGKTHEILVPLFTPQK